MTMSSIFEEFISARKAASLTQAQLAQLSGVNRMTVNRLEAGEDPLFLSRRGKPRRPCATLSRYRPI